MAYTPYYPGYYQPQYYQPSAMPDTFNQLKGQYQPMQQQAIQQASPQTNDRLWVQGEAGAKAYVVAANNTVTLWDSESPTIYVKSADASGIPSMRIFDFTERTTNTPSEHTCKCGDKFVTKDEFKALQAKYYEIADAIEQLRVKPTPKATKAIKEVVE